MHGRQKRKPRGAATLPDEPETAGELIRAARLDKNWTQAELVSALRRVGVHVSKSAVSEWERGQTAEIKAQNQRGISEVLGIPRIALEKGISDAKFYHYRTKSALLEMRVRDQIDTHELTLKYADLMATFDRLPERLRVQIQALIETAAALFAAQSRQK